MTGRLVLAISGASGAAYAQRLLRLLLDAGRQVHLVISPTGRQILRHELGLTDLSLSQLSGRDKPDIILHEHHDLAAPIASGSFNHDGMAIVPCSNHTLAAVANGLADNLLHRAAAVCLKERRRLVLCHREMPLSLIDLRNMEQATLAGAIVAPACPGFYMKPTTANDLVDFVAGRIADLLGVEHGLNTRWGGDGPEPSVTPH